MRHKVKYWLLRTQTSIDSTASTATQDQRLIEHGFPCHQVGAETQRERGASSALPPLYFLHVWWAHRPLMPSRAAIVASLAPAETDPEVFVRQLGIERVQALVHGESWTLTGDLLACIASNASGAEVLPVDARVLYGFRLAAIHISALLLCALTPQAQEHGAAPSAAQQYRTRRRVAAPPAQRTGPPEATAAPCLVSRCPRTSTPPPGERRAARRPAAQRRRVGAGVDRGRLRPRPALAAAEAAWPPASHHGGLAGTASPPPGAARLCPRAPEAPLVRRGASGGLGRCAWPGGGAGPPARPTPTAPARAPQHTRRR